MSDPKKSVQYDELERGDDSLGEDDEDEDEFEECDEWNDYDYNLIEYEE